MRFQALVHIKLNCMLLLLLLLSSLLSNVSSFFHRTFASRECRCVCIDIFLFYHFASNCKRTKILYIRKCKRKHNVKTKSTTLVRPKNDRITTELTLSRSAYQAIEHMREREREREKKTMANIENKRTFHTTHAV